MTIPPPPDPGIEIFETDPGAPTQSVFDKGIPSTNTEAQSLSIILFSPNLQIIASMDNTGSDATSTYSVAVTTGFTFSSTQSVSITEEVGINVEILTEKTSITFALSFTEQWSTSETRTMSFTCPPGKQAFVYQGTLVSKLMAFDARSATYSWVSAPAKALTEIIVTTSEPIGSAPSNPVSVKSS